MSTPASTDPSLLHPAVRSSKGEKLVCAFLAVAAIGLRFYLAVHAPTQPDLKAFIQTLGLFHQGKPIYASTSLYNYTPLWLWILLGLEWLSHRLLVPIEVLIRCLLAVVDAGTALVLFRIAGSLPSALPPWRAATLFLLNPVVIFVSSMQGQFDGLSLFFLMSAILVSLRRESAAASRVETAFYLALSVAIKQITAFHPILWFRGRRNLWVVAIPYVVFFALFLPYGSQWRAIADHVLFYRSVPSSYGFSEWVLFDSRWAMPVGVAALAAGLAAAWALRDRELPRASLLLFLVLLFFAPGFGIHYLVWPLTVGALYAGRGYWLTTFFWAVALAASSWSLSGAGRWTGHLIWLSIALWAIEQLRRLPGERRPESPGVGVSLP